MVNDPKQLSSQDDASQRQATETPPTRALEPTAEPPPARETPLMRQLLENLDNAPIMGAVHQVCRHLGLRAPAARKRVENDLKLQFYFGGQDVACLETSQGRLVVAHGILGSDEFFRALQSLPPDERRRVLIRSVEPWDHPSVLAPTPFAHED